MATLAHPTPLDLDTRRPSLLDTLAAEREATRRGPRDDGPAPAVAGGPTLEDLIAGTWTAVRSGAAAACPACGDALTPRYGAGHHAVAGRCGGCGSELS